MITFAAIPILYGGWLFILALLALTPFLVREWILLARANEHFTFSILLGGSLILSLSVYALYGAPPALGTALFLCIIGLTISSTHKKEFYFVYIGGLFILPITLVSLASIRYNENGLFLTLWLVLVVSSTDIMAYIVGKTFKGPKIAKNISPKKTWSGCLGGLLFAVAFALIGALLSSQHPGLKPNSFLNLPIPVMLSAISISLASQVGDFIISFLKRKRNIKDTGKLIPGHGGLFDRFDSYILSIPTMAFCIAFWDVVTL
jgi:phosphatidate cytidylyltransferase